MQNNLIKIPIVFGVDWPWPSRSNLTWKSKFTQFWACPHDHPPPVEVRISKFWPIMHLSSVKIPVNFRIDWYWSSISFLPEASFGLRVLSLPASVCLCVCLSLCVSVNPELVRAINHDAFKLEPPNLDKRCKTTWLRSLLFWGAIDLDLQGQI